MKRSESEENRRVYNCVRRLAGRRALVGTRLRVLALVMTGARQGKPPTFREIMEALGVSVPTVQRHLAALKRDDLVASEYGRAATVVPRVRFIPAAALGSACNDTGAAVAPDGP